MSDKYGTCKHGRLVLATCVDCASENDHSELSPARGSAKIYGVTHRGTDGETKAYMEDGRVWISDGKGGWLRCNPGVEGYFSPNGESSHALAGRSK